jgi:NADPH-dependent 2,4-dienoyl-CoA reductase/sulfur reductase-like enzyme
MSYDKLLLATGGQPRQAKWVKNIDGAKNVFFLRNADDQEKIKVKA